MAQKRIQLCASVLSMCHILLVCNLLLSAADFCNIPSQVGAHQITVLVLIIIFAIQSSAVELIAV
eukprot:6398613-Ditylum_brightwellii.AAC.1